jgi:hypothetical protein
LGAQRFKIPSHGLPPYIRFLFAYLKSIALAASLVKASLNPVVVRFNVVAASLPRQMAA